MGYDETLLKKEPIARYVDDEKSMTKTIDIHSPQMNFNDVVSLVRKGAEIVLTDASIPFARMIPVSSFSSTRTPGLHTGTIYTSDDFDEPLPDEFWTGQS